MAPMFKDPPELVRYAQRSDPPMEKWPGLPVSSERIMQSYGDPRDWFRYGHRLRSAELVWRDWAVNRKRNEKNLHKNFSWNQVLIIGDYGVGKTTLGIHHARKRFRQGHAVFSNASCLFGWHLEHEEMYTAMGYMPKHSVLLIDEGSAHLSSRLGGGVAITSFGEMNLNSRKQNSEVVYMSAADRDIAYSIRLNCKEVWMPVSTKDIVIEERGSRSSLNPLADPANFLLVWHVWDDFPYRKANIIEGKVDEEGFGPPTYTAFDYGLGVRQSFSLNDTFELAQAGAATMADRDVVKDDLGRFLGKTPGQNGRAKDDWVVDGALLFFANHEYDYPQPAYFTAGQIAAEVGCDNRQVGAVMSRLGIANMRGKGYEVAECFAKIRAAMRETFS